MLMRQLCAAIPMNETWSHMKTWDLVLPPSRPSAQQLARISETIATVPRNSPVAVLGSTPEFRDLLVEMGFTCVYVFERNVGFYHDTAAMRVSRGLEQLVVGDWLSSISPFVNIFAVILSDLTSGNISYADRAAFYNNITRSLRTGGLFLDKVLTHPYEHERISTLEAKYAQLPLNLLSVNYFSCEFLFCSELLDINDTVDSSLFYNELNTRLDNQRARAFAQRAVLITPPDCCWHYGRSWTILEPDYCPELTRRAVHDDEQGSPYFGRVKFFTLSKG